MAEDGLKFFVWEVWVDAQRDSFHEDALYHECHAMHVVAPTVEHALDLAKSRALHLWLEAGNESPDWYYDVKFLKRLMRVDARL